MEKYKVDMIVGNMLNNKKWVWIRHNHDNLSETLKDKEISDDVEKGIVESVLNCWRVKFKE